MTPERIAEILKRVEEAEERAGKATEGPWAWAEYDGLEYIVAESDVCTIEEEEEEDDICISDFAIDQRIVEDFAVTARSDVPDLCAAVRELVAENARLVATGQMKARAK